jgi:hypothetical protein
MHIPSTSFRDGPKDQILESQDSGFDAAFHFVSQHHRAGDLPSYLLMIVVGQIIVPAGESRQRWMSSPPH